jgi:hypothetical protein
MNMSLKHPDREISAEISREIVAINREFLRLLTHPATVGAAQVLGLDGSMVDVLRRFRPAELEQIATAPLLLAEF